MRLALLILGAAIGLAAAPSHAREVVYAADPHNLSVTVYRDPNRGEWGEMKADDPGGFAMISETRMVTLPAGRSTIRFDGVSEGMIGFSAIVTGLPGGTIEKNRNADLLSPAALVNGALGNRVTITRTNPATGEALSEQAIVRTRADGGLVLQSSLGFEAVRCAGLPETIGFDRVPDGLSAKPVFSIDTRVDSGGTYEVTLTYISLGFDWQAHYVATLGEEGTSDDFDLHMLSWLTVLNDNGQSFENAELLVVAGRLNVVSDYQGLADPPEGEPLRLTCYPIGSTAAGSPVVNPAGAPALFDRSPWEEDNTIVVTGAVRRQELMDTPVAFAAPPAPPAVREASEEQLGDLKLYRVPERVTVAAQGLKQVAFLNRDDVRAGFVYVIGCLPQRYRRFEQVQDRIGMGMILVTQNVEDRGLGVALPQGKMDLFEPNQSGIQLVSQNDLRDYASGQDIEIGVGQSQQVTARCGANVNDRFDFNSRRWVPMRAEITNENDHDVIIRIDLGASGSYDVRWSMGETRIKDGRLIGEFTLPAGAEWTIDWHQRGRP